MKKILFVLVFLTTFCHADFADHLKRESGKKTKIEQIKNIDYIYLINLDKRPEKLERCMGQLKPYKISPHRFSAIYGWDLSPKALNELGVKFSLGMMGNQRALHFPSVGNGGSVLELLQYASCGKTYFSATMTPGAIGCTLSHLSVLQDAYDAGFQTIWIMEDDILIEKDPRTLTALMDKLDALVGKKNWDILYTDTDKADREMYLEGNDFESDLIGDLWFFWRPDLDLHKERARFAKREILSQDFIQIGSRMRTHSMLVRRSGMKKILDFYKSNKMFIPYDHELAIIPDLRLFSLRYNVVTHAPAPSDTKAKLLQCDLEQKRKFSESQGSEPSGISPRPGPEGLGLWRGAVHERGYWLGSEVLHEHQFDKQLAINLAVFFLKEQTRSVVDLGAGTGEYARLLRQYQIPCDAYDGNPDSEKISNGIVKVADLSEALDLKKSYDWVLCLEVGEHLPQKYEKILIENIDRHNIKGVILSWAVKGQGGFGHFNEQENSYIKNLMSQYGYVNDSAEENNLRAAALLPWFKNSIMVFRRPHKRESALHHAQ